MKLYLFELKPCQSCNHLFVKDGRLLAEPMWISLEYNPTDSIMLIKNNNEKPNWDYKFAAPPLILTKNKYFIDFCKENHNAFMKLVEKEDNQEQYDNYNVIFLKQELDKDSNYYIETEDPNEMAVLVGVCFTEAKTDVELIF